MSKIHKTHFTVPEMPWKKEEKMNEREQKRMMCAICHENTVWELQPSGRWICTSCRKREEIRKERKKKQELDWLR